MHQQLKNIKHGKNIVSHLEIEDIKVKINNAQKLKIVDGEFFICYESDHEFVSLLRSIENKCTQYINEKYSVTCTAQSIYLLDFNKDREINFNYYNGHYLLVQDNNFKYINTSGSELACIVFLNKDTITFKVLSLSMEFNSGDILIHPLTHDYISALHALEDDCHIILMHFRTLPAIVSNQEISKDIIDTELPQERTHGYIVDNTYHTVFAYNHGLLAALTSILYKMSMYKGKIDNIDTSASPGLDFFKKGHNIDKDIYPCLFRINNESIPNYSHNTLLSHAAIPKYWELTSEQLYMIHPYIDKYFSPSEEVLTKIEYYKTKYNIYPDSTVAVYFRGTDRYIHKFEPDVATKHLLIIERLKELQSKNPNLNVLLQSDDYSFIKTVSKYINNCITISEPDFKPSNDGYPIHYGALDKEQIRICHYCVQDNNRSSLFDDGIHHAICYIAFLVLASQCKFVVTHRGHGPLWMLLYRNSLENFIQL